ncbi:MAG: YqhA family protein, partial [Oricola sp.]|nr:YqhA family protein [Oricola sp.]
LGLPEWMHVEQIGQLKQTIAEVIIVVLFVLFLRIALQTFEGGVGEPSLRKIGGFLMLPVAILVLAGALRLVELHPKPRAGNPAKPPSRMTPAQDDGDAGGRKMKAEHETARASH